MVRGVVVLVERTRSGTVAASSFTQVAIRAKSSTIDRSPFCFAFTAAVTGGLSCLGVVGGVGGVVGGGGRECESIAPRIVVLLPPLREAISAPRGRPELLSVAKHGC